MAEGIGLTQDLFSGFQASDFGTCRAWFKADSLVLSDGDAVGTWADQSGNARDLSQSTAANKPLYKMGVANGKPALLFDGSNDVMSTASFTAKAHPVTAFVVGKRVSGTGNQYMLDGIVAGNRMGVFAAATTGVPSLYSGSTLSGMHDIANDWILVEAVFNTTSSTIALNDVFQVSGDAGSETLTGIRVGADITPGNYWNGYIAEVIYYDAAMSAANRLAVRKYLMAKYKINYFTPSSITGLSSWFCADHIRDLKDADAIPTWLDSYGVYDLAQSTSGNRATLQKFEQNNHHVVRFDGTDDYFVTASFTAKAQPRTYFIVAKHTGTASYDILIDGIGVSNRHAVYYETGTGKLAMYGGSTELLSAADAGTAYVVITAIFNGASSFGYINGTQVITGNPGSNTITGYTVGAAYDFSGDHGGDIMEIIIYDAAVSTSNRQRAEGYLRTKYAI